MGGSAPEHALTEVSDELLLAYERALLRGRFDEDVTGDADGAAELRGELCRLGLLRPVEGDEERLVPLSPQAAEIELLGPVEEAIRSQQQLLEGLRQRLRDVTERVLQEQRRSRQRQMITVVEDSAQVRLHLQEAAWRCAREVRTMQPGGPRDKEVLAEALPRDLAMLERGIRMRTLYQHTVRSDLSTLAYARQVTEAGAEIRTRDEVLVRLIVFDDEVAFVPDSTGRRGGAAIVHEPTVVSFLCTIFDRAWEASAPLIPQAAASDDISDELRRTILKLMARGLKDEAVARQLGMSARTCRRHVAGIMSDLGAASRFQAGVAAVRSGMLAESP